MNPIALGAGLACIIAGIVGGGLKAGGINFPPLASSKRQLGLIVFGVIILFFAQLATLQQPQ